MRLRTRLLIFNVSVIGCMTVVVAIMVYFLVGYSMKAEVRGFLLDEFNEYSKEYEEKLDDLDVVIEDMENHFRNGRMAYPVVCRVYDRSGEIVASAANAGPVPETSQAYISQALDGREIHYDLAPEDGTAIGKYWCAIRPVTCNSGVTYAFEVGLQIDRLNYSLERLRKYILISAPIILVAGTVGAWLIARRGLHPFEALLDNLQRIRSSSLERRLPESGTQDELDRMAQAINSMIEEVDNAFKRIKEFTSDAAHELRTPLTRLTVMLERSLSRSLSSVEARMILDNGYQECIRLRRLIDDLMLLARLDAGEIEGESDVLDLADLVDDLKELWTAASKERQIDIQIHVEHPLQIKGHAMLLRRLLTNLVDNALRYSPEGGLIRVSAERSEEQILVHIHDGGAGVSKHEIPKLFDRFYRIDSDRSGSTGGTGLGLNICLKIVEFHRGTIQVESTEDAGNTFTVRLLAASSALLKEQETGKT